MAPPVCTVSTRWNMVPWPDFQSSAVSSPKRSATIHLPGSHAGSRNSLKLKTPPWSGLTSTTRSIGNEQHWVHVERMNSCLELLPSGIDHPSCHSSSTSNWNLASASHVGGKGFRRTMTHGLAHKSCEWVMVAGYTRVNRFSMSKARTRRHRGNSFTNGISKDRQFSFENAVATPEGWHTSLSPNRQVLVQSLGETFGRTKCVGSRPVPVAFDFTTDVQQNKYFRHICCCSSDDHDESKLTDAVSEDKSVDNLGVQMALALLRFYKSEISPYIPASCRYVPTCSEYAQQAYKKYGFVKGSILTACRLARCNPLGSSGFDPPRWYGEEKPPQV